MASPKTPQFQSYRFRHNEELQRNFSVYSLIGAAFIGMPTWSTIVTSLNLVIYQGGPFLVVYGLLLIAPFSFLISLSLAELASMFPVAGGPQEWVYRLNIPQSIFWSWMTAFCNFIGWVIGIPAMAIATALPVIGMVILYNENYTAHNWHIFLVGQGMIAIGALLNIFGRKLAPLIDFIGFYWYFLTMFILMIIPVSTADVRATPEFVFNTFINFTGWSSNFVCFMTGLNVIAGAFLGIDSVTHLAEEVPNPSVNVPRAMVLAPIVGFLATFAVLVSILFSIPQGSFESILTSPIGYPLLQICLNATKSRTASLIITLLVLYMGIQNIMSCIQIASRIAWSFARDGGFIFPNYFRQVHPTLMVPVRAIVASWVTGAILLALFLGSTSAFNALTSAFVVMTHITYCITIIAFLSKKRQSNFPTNFSLGGWGYFVNLMAVGYMIFTTVFFLLPSFMPVTGTNMNYASAVVGVSLILVVGLWMATGRNNYMHMTDIIAE